MAKVIYPVIGKQTALPIYLAGIGISEYEYHINRENGLISHQILYTSNGSGILHIGGETYRLSKGSLFYMAPEIPHEYYPENGDWTTCWIVFRGKYLKELMKELGFGDYLINENPDCELLNQLFGMIFSAASDPVSGAQKCSLLVYEYVLESRRQLVNNAFTAASGSAIGNAVAYINIKYKEDITLNQLFEISGYSHQHFCRLFKAQMGMRPMEYIARRRIAQSKTLLADSELTISQIGSDVGYPEPTYFGMVFRKYEGISPSEYRKRRNSLEI